MLLIAVEGPVGSGKTTLLRDLAEWARGTGKVVDGFVALGGDRPEPGRGAERYDLRMLGEERVLPFAVRDPAASPPYRFEAATGEALRAWAEGLRDRPRPALLVLDELGRVEAAGGGHLALWPSVREAAPEVVAVAVRAELREAIEERLGRPFDLRVDASDPDAGESLRSACLAHRDWTRVGAWGAGSGGVEMTLGSALHAARIPFRGLFLATFQAILMSYAGDGLGERRRVVWVPFIAAGLKALSPAGGRLRPMLAISVQGVLFQGATSVLGWRALGIAVGGGLVGAWSSAQGIVIQLLLIGSDLLRACEAVVEWIAGPETLGESGVVALALAWIGVCGLASGTATWVWWRRRRLPRLLERGLERGARGFASQLGSSPRSWRTAALHALRDLARPFFWLPLLVVVAVLLAAGSPWERSLWIVVRAATIGFLLFALARGVDMNRLVERLRARGHWGPALAFRQAMHGEEEAREREEEHVDRE